MANWSDLKAAVASIVKTNGNNEITGQLLQNVLNNIISNVGLNSSFAGIATPETNPGTPDGNVFYLATTAGTYSNFNGIVINSGEAVILEWKGSWVKKDSGFSTKDNLYQLNAATSFANMIIYNEYYDVNGVVQKEAEGANTYRRLPLLAVKDKITISNFNFNNGKIRLFDSNKAYIKGADITLVREPQSTYTLPNNALYVGIYWKKSNDDYSASSIETGDSMIFSTLLKGVSENTKSLESLQSSFDTFKTDFDTNANIRVELAKGLSVKENVIYNHYYDSLTGLMTKEPEGQDKYRCLPLIKTNEPIFVNISGLYINIRVYDKNNTIIETISLNALTSNQVVLPTECAAIGIYWQKDTDSYDNDLLYNSDYAAGIPNNLDIIESKNIYDANSTTVGYLRHDGSIESIGTSYETTSEYIYVKRGQSITFSPRVRKFIAYTRKEQGAFIPTSFYDAEEKVPYTFTAEVPCFVRATFYKDDKEKQIEYSNTATEYEEPGVKISNLIFPKEFTEVVNTLSVLDNSIKLNLGYLGEYVIYDAFYDVKGVFTQLQEASIYRCLPIIEVTNNILSLQINGKYIGVRCFNERRMFIGTAQMTSPWTESTLLDGTKYVGIYWQKNNDDYSKDWIDFGSELPKRVSTIEDAILNDKRLKEITIANSDKIAIIGDSYTESHYTVKNKAYINKLSLFSDYQFVNWGLSGDIYIGRLNAIRNGANHYGSLSFNEISPKYAMMCCFTNDIKYMNLEDYIKCLDNICTVLKGLGTEPIICTEYHTGNSSESNTGVKTALQNYANKHGYLFFDIATYTDTFRPNSWSSHYSPFWGGSHAGTRTNAMESDPYEMYLKGLERPEKSIKIFRLRESWSKLDDLLFKNINERAKLFHEINVGHTYITDPSYVDNCTSAAQTTQKDEYQQLQSGESIVIGKACLISVTLPSDSKNISKVYLSVELNGTDINVYALNRVSEPYNSYNRYTRFDYTNIVTKPSVGDTYTSSNDGNSKVFTVVKVVEGIGDEGSIGSIFCTPSDRSTNTGGTLTKVSGVGDSSIPYSYRAIGYDTDNITSDTCGHWEKLSLTNDGYTLGNINGFIQKDKIDFLITNSGEELTISNVSVKYIGEGQKLFNRKQIELKYNRNNPNVELLPSNTFDVPGSSDTNYGAVTSDIYEHIKGKDAYPIGCSSVIKVTDTNVISCRVDKSSLKEYKNVAYLELWCRYFPDIYSNGSGNQITETSFDYNDVFVEIGESPLYTTIESELVNTYWKIVRIPITISDNKSDLPVKVYSNSRGIEIAYISLKYGEPEI